MGWDWAWPTLGATLICILIGIFILGRTTAYSKDALASLMRLIPKSRQNSFDIHRVDNEAELLEISEIDQISYGDDGIAYETLSTWWKAYPRGIWAMKEYRKRSEYDAPRVAIGPDVLSESAR